MDRRQFVKAGAATGVGAAIAPSVVARALGRTPAPPATAGSVLYREGASAAGFLPTHVGVSWHGDPGAVVQVRWLDARGRWSRWTAMPADPHMADGERQWSVLAAVGEAHDLQIRTASGTTGQVRTSLIRSTNEQAAADPAATLPTLVPPPTTERATTTTAPPPPGSTRAAKVPQPGIITRAQWGADESLRRDAPSFAPIVKLIVHHTVTANNDPDPAATVRAIYAYHVQGRGWSDIGYNFLVDSHGRIYEGRWSRSYLPGEVPTGETLDGRGVIGAHAENHNTGACGVAVLGTYDGSAPPAAAINGVQSLLAWKAARHSIDVGASSPYTRVDGGGTEIYPDLCGHRDTKSTECPGNAFYAYLPSLRKNVRTIVQQARGRTPGYWTVSRDGKIANFGQAELQLSPVLRLNRPIVDVAPTPSGHGLWLLGEDGGIFTTGDAQFHGSTGNLRLNAPILGLAPTASGNGYWLVASDGGIFCFGDARFFGSTGGIRLNRPIVGMARTPSGKGYWLVASDGGVFSFGDAGFFGSTGAVRLNQPIVDLAASPSGKGYWMVAADGGIFSFGDARYCGSVPEDRPAGYPGAVAIEATTTGAGYYIADGSGGVACFGDAKPYGSTAFAAGSAGLALVPGELP